MIRIRQRTFPLIVLYAVALHTAWAACGWADVSAFNGTALHGIFNVFGSTTPLACLTAAGLAMASLIGVSRNPVHGFMLMMPQQCLLLLSAISAVVAIGDSQFADGIIRSRAFIASDQLPAVLGAALHTVAMVRYALNK